MRKQTGLNFRRQHPIGPYIADFYCHSAACVVEVDGISHDHRQKTDAVRDNYMKEQGLRTLRFTEKDVCDDVEAVILTIQSQLKHYDKQ